MDRDQTDSVARSVRCIDVEGQQPTSLRVLCGCESSSV